MILNFKRRESFIFRLKGINYFRRGVIKRSDIKMAGGRGVESRQGHTNLLYQVMRIFLPGVRVALSEYICTVSPTGVNVFLLLLGCGGVAQLVEHWTGTPLTQVRFPGAARDFSPRVIFQCRLSHGVRITPCANVCINVCGRVKDPVVRFRVRWVMETLKHPACTVGWVARLCRSWLSPG